MQFTNFRSIMVTTAIVLVGTLTAACGGSSVASGSSGPIAVGFVVPYSGPVAEYGKDADEAWALAVEKYGSSVNGRQIQVKKYDDKCNPSEAVGAVKQAIGAGVVVLVGPTCSGNVIATQQIAANAKIPIVTQAYAPEITAQGSKYIWRMPASATVLNGNLAVFLQKKGWRKNIAVIHDNTGYGQAEGQTITEGFKNLGITPVANITYKVGATDFSGEIQRLKSAGADHVCLMGYDPDTARIALQMQQLGLNAEICANEVLGFADSLELGGAALNGAYFASVFQPDAERTASFNKAWTAKYGTDANPEQYEYYLSAVTVIQALKSTKGDISPDSVNLAISKLNFDVDGAATLAFTSTGDPKCPTVLVGTIENVKAITVQDDSQHC